MSWGPQENPSFLVSQEGVGKNLQPQIGEVGYHLWGQDHRGGIVSAASGTFAGFDSGY